MMGTRIVTWFAGHDCFTTTLGNAALLSGLNPYVVGAQWFVSYDASQAKLSPLDGMCLLRRPHLQMLTDWYSVEVTTERAETSYEFQRNVTLSLREGFVVIPWADAFYLRHTSNYGRTHFPHRFVLVETNATGARLIDSMEGWRHTGWVTWEQLESALISDHLLRGPWGVDNRRLTFERLRLSTHRDDGRLPVQRIRDRLRADATDMGSPEPGIGYRALVEGIQDFASWCSGRGRFPPAVTDEARTFFAEIASYRSAFAGCLEEGFHDDFSIAAGLIEEFKEAARDWRTLRNAFVTRVIFGENLGAAERILARAEVAALREGSLAARLQEVL